MFEGRVSCSAVYAYVCMSNLRYMYVAGSVIFTCRLVEVCDARLGVARAQVAVNGFGQGRNTRLSVLMVDKA